MAWHSLSLCCASRGLTLHTGIGAAEGTNPHFDPPDNPASQSIRFSTGMPAEGATGTDGRQGQVQPSSIFSFHAYDPLVSIRNVTTGVGLKLPRNLS